MRTYKLVAGALAALALTIVTSAWLLAAPDVPDKGLRQELHAPIPPRAIVSAHSEAWNDVYFDKLTRPQPILHTEDQFKEKWRGGLAEQQAQKTAQQQAANAVPVPPRAGLKAHSSEWTDYYLDRYASSHIPSQASEHVNANSWQGGLAQGVEAVYK